jgi:F-box/leucine-rich repeat protein 2/20
VLGEAIMSHSSRHRTTLLKNDDDNNNVADTAEYPILSTDSTDVISLNQSSKEPSTLKRPDPMQPSFHHEFSKLSPLEINVDFRKEYAIAHPTAETIDTIIRHSFEKNHGSESMEVAFLGKLFQEHLPRELQLYIFGYLDMKSRCRCAKVCKYWRQLFLDGELWCQLDLSPYFKKLLEKDILQWVQIAGPFLSRLNLRGYVSCNNHLVKQIASACPNLKELDLTECRSLTPCGLALMTSICCHINILKISGIIRMNNRCIESIVRHCPHLKEVDLSWCRHITSAGITMLAKECHSLERLSLAGCSLVNDDIFHHIVGFPLLRRLNLQLCKNITDDGIKLLAMYCHHLRHVTLSGCHLLTDLSLCYLSHRSSCIMGDTSNEDASSMREDSELQILEVAGCSFMSDYGFREIAKHCRQLRKLDLEECVQVTDISLQCFGDFLPQLGVIILSCCDKITDQGFMALSMGCPLLSHIEVDGCSQLTDETIEHFKRLPFLRCIDAFDCRNLSRNAIEELRQNYMPRIKTRGFDWSIEEQEEDSRHLGITTTTRSSRKLCVLM